MEKKHDFQPNYLNSNPEYGNISSIYKEFFISNPVKVVFDKSIRALCGQPYYKHSKGCSNLGERRPDCPPLASYFPEIYETEDCLVVAVLFDFQTYIELKRKRHPDWSNRALLNQRHWQAHLRAELDKQVNKTLKENAVLREEYALVSSPEAMGVNLQETCRLSGLELLWPEQDEKWQIISLPEYICQVGLLAKKKPPKIRLSDG